jgi:iron complex outermembrane receptor protein
LGSSFQLDHLSIDNVEKIEIVKGAAAMLYGSDATGGVINIITKEKVADSINVSYSNLKQKAANLSLQAGKLAFGTFYDETGSINRISSDETSTAIARKPARRSRYDDYYNYAGGKKIGFNTTYKFSDAWSFHYEHSRDSLDRQKLNTANDELLATLNDTDTRDFWQLQYNKGGLNFNLYQQIRDSSYNTLYTAQFLKTYKEPGDQALGCNKMSSRGFDLQNSWQNNKYHYLAGVTFYNEKYNGTDSLRSIYNGPYSRNQYSLFMQSNFDIAANTKLTLGARQQYADMQEIQQSIFLPQLQLNHDIDKNNSLFANVGRSFRLPSFYEGYVIGTPASVKPENGWSYEIGYKQRRGKDTFTASLFSIDLKDKITSVYQGGKAVSVNYPEFINRGLDLNWVEQRNEHWTYTIGGTVSNPQLKDNENIWNDTANKWQITSGISYKNKAFDANLSASVLGARAYSVANSIPTTLVLNYKTAADRKWTLAVRNLLNRQDTVNEINSAAGIRYYTAPRSIQLEHTYKF